MPGVAGAVVGALLVALGIWWWPEPTSEDGWEEGELVILTGADDSPGKWRQTLLDMWNAEHPNNKARFVELPQTADGQRSEMLNRAEADNDDVDIYNLDVTLVAEFAAPPGKDPFIRPVDQTRLPPGFLDGFLDKPLETCRYEDDDTLWALPFNTDAGLLFYRDDVGIEPPTTWEQVIALADDPPAAGETTAYVGQLGNYEGQTVNALEAVWAEGGEVVDDQGEVVATREMMIKAIRRLTDAPGATEKVMHPGARGFDESQSREAFAGGEALLMRNWPVQYSALFKEDRNVTDPQRVSFKVTTLPGSAARVPGPSVLGGQNLAIAEKSGKPRAAQALIEFLTQESSQLLLARYSGFAPTREAPYADPAIREQYAYLPVLKESVEHAKLRPVTPQYANFSVAFRKIVTYAMDHGGEPPADFVEQLDQALEGR